MEWRDGCQKFIDPLYHVGPSRDLEEVYERLVKRLTEEQTSFLEDYVGLSERIIMYTSKVEDNSTPLPPVKFPSRASV